MSKPFQVQSFDHLTLVVANLKATRHFYVDLLGMEEILRPDFDFAGSWFAVGKVQIHVILASELSGQAGWGDRGVTVCSRGHHFAFQISDIESAAEQASEFGIEIAAGPKQRPDGAKQLFVFDPDQHLIELFQVVG